MPSEHQQPIPQGGWFKATRSPDALELWQTAPNAFRLAYLIAWRARYSDGFNRHGLGTGEALLGDWCNYGMTEQEYRTSKRQLAKWKFATFRLTPKGTVARLVDSRLFEVTPSTANTLSNTQLTPEQHPANTQLTPTVRKKEGIQGNNGQSVGAERPVELPTGFPATVDEAKMAALFAGVPEDFAGLTWNKAMSRAGRDAKGQPIRSWRHYLATEWQFQQNRAATHPQPRQRTAPDHSKGF